MANLAELRVFIDGLKDDRLFITGAVGGTSSMQDHTQKLRRCFAVWYMNPKDEKAKQAFEEALLGAHIFGVVTDDELDRCQQLVEEE